MAILLARVQVHTEELIMANQHIVSGNIVFEERGLRSENYFIKIGADKYLTLNTHDLTPDDLRTLAHHLEELRAERDSQGSEQKDAMRRFVDKRSN